MIKLWNVTTGEERATLRHYGAVRSLTFSHDSKILASGSNDYTAKLWDVATFVG
jgi:WD40 repeat protein